MGLQHILALIAHQSTHSSRWKELREICKQLDTHFWRILWVILPQSSVDDMIVFPQIMPFFLMERIWMYPHIQIMFSVMCDDRCAPLFKGVRDNVAFLDIKWDETWVRGMETNGPMMGLYRITSKDAFDAFILSCDWCSFVNGMFHTLVQNIEADPELLRLSDPYVDLFVDVVKDRTAPIDPNLVPAAPPEYATKYKPMLDFIAGFRTRLDAMETRWCPFKRAKSAYFRNTDPRFQPLEPDVVFQVGKILATQQNITCDECPRIVNGATEFAHDPDRVSLVQPMLDLVWGVSASPQDPLPSDVA